MTTLTPSQKAVAEQIIHYGKEHGFTEAQQRVAVKAAYIESSLGVGMQNPHSTAKGLYGYTNAQWAHSGKGGDALNNADQIAAFYGDLKHYTDRYHGLSRDTLGDISVDQYIYIKHHDGANATNFSPTAPGRDIWDHKDTKALDELFPASPSRTGDGKFASQIADTHRALGQSLAARDYDPAARDAYPRHKEDMNHHLAAIDKNPSLLAEIPDPALRKSVQDRLGQWRREKSPPAPNPALQPEP